MDKETESAIIGDFVSLEAIQAQEKAYRQSVVENRLTEELKFTYSWHLIKSQYKNDIRKGIKLLEEMIKPGKDQRDYYYFMAVGHYKLEEYEASQSCVNRVLQMEPNNYQAKQLKELVQKKIKRDGLIGLGVLGGAAAVGGVLAAGAVALIGVAVAKASR